MSFVAADGTFQAGPSGVEALQATGRLIISGNVVPEPSTLGLMGLMLCSWAIAAARRRPG